MWDRLGGCPLDRLKNRSCPIHADSIWRGTLSGKFNVRIWDKLAVRGYRVVLKDAQAGALTQLGLIAQREQRLDDFIADFEATAEANPQDLQSLETLVKVNILMEDTDKTLQTIDRLIALSPNDLSYRALQLNRALERDLDYETAKKLFGGISPAFS